MPRKILVGLMTLLLLAQALPPIALAGGARTARVTADSLNLRAGPGTDFAVVRGLTRDTVVTVRETKGDWWRVELADGTTGWAAARYLEEVEASAAPDARSETDRARAAKAPDATPAKRADAGGGGSTLGKVAKWGCLVGAVAGGGLWFAEHSSGNDAYDEYKQLYTDGDVDAAEEKYQAAKDHDDKAQVYLIAGGVCLGLFALQQFVLGGGGDDATGAGLVPAASPVTWDPRTGTVRAALVRVRW